MKYCACSAQGAVFFFLFSSHHYVPLCLCASLPDKAMQVLISCLSSKEAETRCMGASALWALLHNNQRVRARRTRVHRNSKITAPSINPLRLAVRARCSIVPQSLTRVRVLLVSTPKAKTTLKRPSVRLRIEEAHSLSKKGLYPTRSLALPEFHFGCAPDLSHCPHAPQTRTASGMPTPPTC